MGTELHTRFCLYELGSFSCQSFPPLWISTSFHPSIFSSKLSSRLRVTGTILVWSPPSLPVTSPGHSLHRSKQRPASSALQAAPFLLVGNFQAWTWGHQETQNQVLMGLSTGLSGRLRLSANLLIDIKKTSGIWKKKKKMLWLVPRFNPSWAVLVKRLFFFFFACRLSENCLALGNFPLAQAEPASAKKGEKKYQTKWALLSCQSQFGRLFPSLGPFVRNQAPRPSRENLLTSYSPAWKFSTFEY